MQISSFSAVSPALESALRPGQPRPGASRPANEEDARAERAAVPGGSRPEGSTPAAIVRRVTEPSAAETPTGTESTTEAEPPPEPPRPAGAAPPPGTEPPADAEEPTDPSGLTEEEKAMVAELRARDAEVKAHEAAHASIGGGTPTYTFQRGPDGNAYAVGGSVSIDASGGSTPRETIAKMQRVRAAALAPANPSGQDRAVAASASQRMMKAQAELAKEAAEAANPQRDDEASAAEEAPATEEAAAPSEPQSVAGHDHVPGQDCPICAPKVGRYTKADAAPPGVALRA